MSSVLPLAHEKKLTIVFRLEPGSLGPDGDNIIEDFCKSAQIELSNVDNEFINWEIIPRYDKTLPERQYKINNKLLSREMTKRYLELFDRHIDHFEDHLDDLLGELINQYLGY
jgi:hypothetical protein